MNSIFEYTDYRKYLKDFYDEKKALKSTFSYRFIAQRVGFKSAGHFTQILQGKADISDSLAFKFAEFMKLKKRESDYFEILVAFNQAKTFSEEKRYFEKLVGFKEFKIKLISAHQYEFFLNWYNIAIREVLAFFPFKDDYAMLGRMVEPPISAEKAKEAIDLLEGLGFIGRNEKGRFERTDPVMSTGLDAHSQAIRKFQHDTMDLAKGAMDQFPRGVRSISTLTLSLSENSYKIIEEEMSLFRRKLLDIARREEKVDRVYQFNFQIFPVSKIYDK